MLQSHDDPDLAVYVIWSDQLGAEEHHVPEAAELLDDPRALHYWDAERLVGRAYEDVIGTPMPAWDVWIVHGREATWGAGSPPSPAWWEHQLGAAGMPPERVLDAERFGRKTRELLDVPRSREEEGVIEDAVEPGR